MIRNTFNSTLNIQSSTFLSRVLLLPLALVLTTVLGLGCYYEASDDTTIAWLFSGVLAPAPVPAVPLYFRGYGRALAALYTAAPMVPWFGLLLGSLLAAATVLVFAVLDRLLRPHLRPGQVTAALAAFFLVGWLEHWLWFSYVRVALLLAGAAVLFAAQRPGRPWAVVVGLAGLGAAWLMRPSLAVVGFGAALPAAWLLAGGWRRAAPVLLSGALLLALATAGAAALRTPAEAHTQTLDGYFARILDFGQLQACPRTPADSLGTAAVGLWLMGDSALVNEALCRRAYVFDAPHFWEQQVPAKVGLRLGLLGRDYFPMLLLLGVLTASVASGGRPRRALLWLVTAAFGGMLLVFAGWLKLPPRLALPLLDFWLLTALAVVLSGAKQGPANASTALLNRFSPWAGRAALAVGAAVLLAYAAKVGHRVHVLRQEQRRHRQALRTIEAAGADRVRVLAGTNDLLKSLSPFRSYRPGPGPVLLLTGWPSHDASQRRQRVALGGSADQTTCLCRLASPRPGRLDQPPVWVLSEEAAAWLDRRFRFEGAPLRLVPGNALSTEPGLRFYRVRPAPPTSTGAATLPMP